MLSAKVPELDIEDWHDFQSGAPMERRSVRFYPPRGVAYYSWRGAARSDAIAHQRARESAILAWSSMSCRWSGSSASIPEEVLALPPSISREDNDFPGFAISMGDLAMHLARKVRGKMQLASRPQDRPADAVFALAWSDPFVSKCLADGDDVVLMSSVHQGFDDFDAVGLDLQWYDLSKSADIRSSTVTQDVLTAILFRDGISDERFVFENGRVVVNGILPASARAINRKRLMLAIMNLGVFLRAEGFLSLYSRLYNQVNMSIYTAPQPEVD